MKESLETDYIGRPYFSDSTPFEIYMRQICQIPLLTPEEEQKLARKISAGKQPAARLAWEQMVKANLRLVVKIAKAFEHFGLPLLDLISEGNIGLMKAVDRFDSDRGAKFSTYAAFWIKQAIRSALSDDSKTIRLPVHMGDKIRKYRSTVRDLWEKLGREPTDEEVAFIMGMKIGKLRRMKLFENQTKSLDEPLPSGYEDGANTIAETVPDPNSPDPAEEAGRADCSGELQMALKVLNHRERTIITRRFDLDGSGRETLEQVGEEFGLTRERIRQIANIALGKLRGVLVSRAKKGHAQRTRIIEERWKAASSKRRLITESSGIDTDPANRLAELLASIR